MDFFSVIFTVRDCLVFEDKLKAVVLTLNKCGWQDSSAISSPSGGRLQ